MKKYLFLPVLFLAITVFAHEFWLQPQQYIFSKGQTATVRFRVGENFEGENWNGNRDKVNYLTLYKNKKGTDITSLVSDHKGDSILLELPDSGTYMIAYNGHNSYIELQPDKFREYAEEDGLTEAIEYREKHNETDSISREYYQRCAKTILQAGTEKGVHALSPTELPFDIIPQVHPHSLAKDGIMKLRLLFNKKPFTNGLVNVWHRLDNNTVRIQLQSDSNGMVSFPCVKKGAWMVSAVKMVRLTDDSKAQWQSYWGSCTWGYE